MPRSGLASPRAETDRRDEARPRRTHRANSVFDGFGDAAAFEGLGHASEDAIPAAHRASADGARSTGQARADDGSRDQADDGRRDQPAERNLPARRGHDDEDESYRVEVERYWRRTASRRSQLEARSARRVRRVSGEVAPDVDARARASAPRGADRAPARSAERRTPRRAERPAPRSDEPFFAAGAADATGDGGGSGDPYRELLSSWAREHASEPEAAAGGARRTVTITGHGAEGVETRNGTRSSSAERHRNLPRHERAGFQPDRVAMWAVLLGVLMILAATATAHAAVLVHHVH